MKMKKLLAIGCAASCAAAMMATPVFAVPNQVTQPGTSDTKAMITVSDTSNDPNGEGDHNALVTMDVSVTEQLDFLGQKDCTLVLTSGQEYVVKNNAAVGSVRLVQVAGAAAPGWKLVANDASALKQLAIGSKVVGFTFDTQDLSKAVKTLGTELAPTDEYKTSSITGSIAPQKKNITEQAATFTATLEMVEAKEIV